jgi:hypothetical protein
MSSLGEDTVLCVLPCENNVSAAVMLIESRPVYSYWVQYGIVRNDANYWTLTT